MKIIVFAEQFVNGLWDTWEHKCNPKEAEALLASARTIAKSHHPKGRLAHEDVLEGARSIFNIQRGALENPQDGDIQVYCVCVEETVIGVYEKIRQYSERITEAHQFAELALGKSA
ncbi:MAG TPA: hypothetical protein VMT38_10285 [Terracidiphilus sp.]|nr:hypothetical protein [Terracidiphilus sp.]